ncbi:MAG: hypothetical protein ABL962_00185 [Fimbriimonadaceae bacterium]
MKKLAILAAATGVVGAASAQSVVETNISLRGGVQFPTSADLDGMMFGFGVDVSLNQSISFLRSGTTYLSLDWMSKNFKFNRNYIVPVCINQRFKLNTSAETIGGTSTYAFFGIGAAIIDFGQSSTVLCARAGLGADFSPNVFGEITLMFTTRTKNTNVQGNHFGAYLGYKF